MVFHYIKDNQIHLAELVFASSLDTIKGTRPNYVVIDKKEFEDSGKNESQMIAYVTLLKRQLALGGKIYIEATP